MEPEQTTKVWAEALRGTIRKVLSNPLAIARAGNLFRCISTEDDQYDVFAAADSPAVVAEQPSNPQGSFFFCAPPTTTNATAPHTPAPDADEDDWAARRASPLTRLDDSRARARGAAWTHTYNRRVLPILGTFEQFENGVRESTRLSLSLSLSLVCVYVWRVL